MAERRITVWHYRTSVGIFEIRLRPEDGRYLLRIYDSSGDDFETLGSYHSPHAAAADVYMGATGFNAWDSRARIDHPSDLSEWEPGRARSSA